MKKIILSLVIVFILYLFYLILIRFINPSKKNKIHNKQFTGNNKQFLSLYEKNKKLDELLLHKYQNEKLNYEKQNFKHSYTPKTLLDDRVRIHIDLDNENFKDTLGL